MKIISSVLIVLAILLMTSETILQAFPKQALKTKTGIQQIALIDIYSQQIDMAVDNGKSVRKFFGEVYIENNHSEWKEFKSEEALGSVETSDSAFLFLKNSTPVLAGITFSSGSGDGQTR